MFMYCGRSNRHWYLKDAAFCFLGNAEIQFRFALLFVLNHEKVAVYGKN